jgi:hypothetical protein
MSFLQSVLEDLFRQSVLFQLGVFVVNGLIFYGISMMTMLAFNRRADVAGWTPVGPYFASISVIFALFLAFHASDIWTNKHQAERAYIEAGSAIKRIDNLSAPDALNLPEVRGALRHYVRYVFQDEWRKNRNDSVSARAEEGFHRLQRSMVQANRDLPGAIAAQLNALMNDVARTRSDRLWIGANHTEASSWFAVWMLGLLTHLAIASIHFDKPKAGAIALLLLALTTTLAFWSLGIVDDPYRYSDELNPSNWLPGS